MSTTHYTSFIEQTLLFTRRLIIKSEASVTSMNNFVISVGINLSDDPTTWKYYMNLAGEYHSMDKLMYVISLDNGETIEFTKEALIRHPLTRINYLPGLGYYEQLVDTYPQQELLIRGIINPVDKELAVNALDHTILSYDKSLLEENETNLIPNLQTLLFNHNVRWNNSSFNVVDDLYPTAYLGLLYYNIPGWIQNIRLANAKTANAHSFHIKEYLKSHGRLDRYVEYMTKTQMLFLYRNILYLERNVGKNDTFFWLKEKLFDHRRIGLAEYDMKHNVSDLIDNLRPEVEFDRKALNNFHNSQRYDKHTLEELLIKQRGLAFNNGNVEKIVIEDDLPRFKASRKNELKTKVLESSLIDYSKTGAILKEELQFAYWVYYAFNGLYDAVVTVTHPKTSIKMHFNTRDAFILFLYSINRSFGVTLTTIPNIEARLIRKPNLPELETVEGMVKDKRLSEKLKSIYYNFRVKEEVLFSTYDFVRLVDDRYNEFFEHREIYSLEEHKDRRGEIQAVLDHLYMNKLVEINQTLNYTDWLSSKGIEVDNLSTLEYQTLAQDLLIKGTGRDTQALIELPDIQRAMIAIMKQLTSYTVHYLNEINEEPIIYWDWPAIRVGDTKEYLKDSTNYSIGSKIVNGVYSKASLGVSMGPNQLENNIFFKGLGGVDLWFNNFNKTIDKRKDFVQLPLARTRVNSVTITEF